MNKLFCIFLSSFLFLGSVEAGPLSKVGKGAIITSAFGKLVNKNKSALNKINKRSVKVDKAINTPLASNELKVGTYGNLSKNRIRNNGVESHHMPSDKYMGLNGVSKNDGIAMNLHKDRHSLTRTYKADNKTVINSGETPRNALGRDVKDVRKILQDTKQYSPEVRNSLQEVIKQNKNAQPKLYEKVKK